MSEKPENKANSNLHIEIEHRGNVLNVKINRVDEHTDFDKLLINITTLKPNISIVNLDVGEVSTINSVGIRGWLLFLQKLKNISPYQFDRVNELFVEQSGIVPDVLGTKGTQVLSFEVPYFCPNCSIRLTEFVKMDEVKKPDGTVSFPRRQCSQCKKNLKADFLEEDYQELFDHSKK